jgi:mRNA (guanine-N7-)-methyltransferase
MKRPRDDSPPSRPPKRPPSQQPNPNMMSEYSRTKKDIQTNYSERKNQSILERNSSPIISIKKFNNWVKGVLISKYTKKGFRVLDVCSGKGGDISKWQKCDVRSVVFVDLVHDSIHDSMDRFNKTCPNYEATFIVADCHLPELNELFEHHNLKFDISSCQFALHYSFESEDRARGFLLNISNSLREGAFFISTIPNSEEIKKRAVANNPFGNDYYSIEFDQVEHFAPYGCSYTFWLKDAIDNVPEFVVDKTILVSLAEEYDLELVEYFDFWDFFDDHKNNPVWKKLYHVMMQGQSKVSSKSREVIGLYSVYVFRKKPFVDFAVNEKNLPGFTPRNPHEDIITFENFKSITL